MTTSQEAVNSWKGRPASVFAEPGTDGAGPAGILRKRAATLSSQMSLFVSRRNRQIQVSRPMYLQQTFDEGFDAGQRGVQKNVTPSVVWRSLVRRLTCTRACFGQLLLRFFPFVISLQGYSLKDDLVGDVLAGVTVGITNVPQGMGYAILASLPPVYGLYVSFFPPILYFIFGTSRHNSIGVFAVASLMIASAIETAVSPVVQTTASTEALTNSSLLSTHAGSPYMSTTALFADNASSALLETAAAPRGGDDGGLSVQQRVALACSLSLIVGLMQVLMGLLRLGFVTIYLSDSLISGFTTGVAFHILTSQLPSLLGVKVGRFNGPLKLGYTYASLFSRMSTIKVVEPVMGLIALGVLIAIKEGINEKFKAKMKMPVPIELVLVVAGTATSYFLHLSRDFSVKVVGAIPAGFSVPEVPSLQTFQLLVSNAFALAVVTFAVSVSLAKTFAKRNNYEVDANQELIAYGMTNALSSFFGCFPSCSSLSRSAIQENQGGRTQIAGVVSSVVILIVLLWMGPLLEELPGCILAAIVIVGLKGTFMQFNQLKPLWDVSKHDFAIWIVTFTAVVVIDVDLGLVSGVAFGLLTVVFRSQTAYTCLLGRIPHTDLYKDKSVYKTVEELSCLRVFRMDAPLHYVNAEHFRRKLYKLTTVNPRQLSTERSKVTKRANHEQDVSARAALQEVVKVAADDQHHTNESCWQRAAKSCRTTSDRKKCTDEEGMRMVESSRPPVVPLHERSDWPSCTIQCIVIDCSTMGYIDLAGINVLKTIYDEYKQVGVNLLFANCKAGVRQMFARSGLYEKVPQNSMYVTIHDAVIGALNQLQDDAQRDKLAGDIITGSVIHVGHACDSVPDVQNESDLAETSKENAAEGVAGVDEARPSDLLATHPADAHNNPESGDSNLESRIDIGAV